MAMQCLHTHIISRARRCPRWLHITVMTVTSEELADVLGVGVAAGQLRPQHEAVVGQVAGQAPSQGQGPHPAHRLHEDDLRSRAANEPSRSFHNHGEDPNYDLLLLESGYYCFYIETL